jgi:hypothetical protein
MFDGFHAAMGGWPWTFPGAWASGFRNYAQSRNEHFTLETRLPGTYWQIVSDINAAWPLGLMGEMDIGGKMKPHWVAVEGYFWSSATARYEIDAACTFVMADRWLCWHMLNAPDALGPWVIAVRDAD